MAVYRPNNVSINNGVNGSGNGLSVPMPTAAQVPFETQLLVTMTVVPQGYRGPASSPNMPSVPVGMQGAPSLSNPHVNAPPQVVPDQRRIEQGNTAQGNSRPSTPLSHDVNYARLAKLYRRLDEHRPEGIFFDGRKCVAFRAESTVHLNQLVVNRVKLRSRSARKLDGLPYTPRFEQGENTILYIRVMANLLLVWGRVSNSGNGRWALNITSLRTLETFAKSK